MFDIQIVDNKELGYGVDARTLWTVLESGHKFADWAKVKIKQSKAVEGVDYIAYSVIPENGGKRTEYTFSIRISKKIAMLECTDIGDKVRDYFLECEEKALQMTRQQAPTLPQDYEEALEALLIEVRKNKVLTHRNEIIEHSENTYTASDIAKELGISAVKLNKLLYAHGIQFKRGSRWIPYAGYEHYYSIKEVINDEQEKSYVTTRFTLEGKCAIIDLLGKN